MTTATPVCTDWQEFFHDYAVLLCIFCISVNKCIDCIQVHTCMIMRTVVQIDSRASMRPLQSAVCGVQTCDPHDESINTSNQNLIGLYGCVFHDLSEGIALVCGLDVLVKVVPYAC